MTIKITNSKETSTTNNNLTSKYFPAIDSIDFHLNKLGPENDTSDIKKYHNTKTPKSTLTTTTNNNTNSANTNNSENNTNSKLIPSRFDEESNEPEECDNAYAAKQDDVKQKNPFLNSYHCK